MRLHAPAAPPTPLHMPPPPPIYTHTFTHTYIMEDVLISVPNARTLTSFQPSRPPDRSLPPSPALQIAPSLPPPPSRSSPASRPGPGRRSLSRRGRSVSPLPPTRMGRAPRVLFYLTFWISESFHALATHTEALAGGAVLVFRFGTWGVGFLSCLAGVQDSRVGMVWGLGF